MLATLYGASVIGLTLKILQISHLIVKIEHICAVRGARFVSNTVFLIDIYDKSGQSSISDKELRLLASLCSPD